MFIPFFHSHYISSHKTVKNTRAKISTLFSLSDSERERERTKFKLLLEWSPLSLSLTHHLNLTCVEISTNHYFEDSLSLCPVYLLSHIYSLFLRLHVFISYHLSVCEKLAYFKVQRKQKEAAKKWFDY